MDGMTRQIRRIAVLIAAGATLVVCTPAVAQDGTMTFGEDEAKEAQQGDQEDSESSSSEEGAQSDGGSDGGDGAMTFGTDEAKEATDATKVGVVVVPVKELSAKQQDTLKSRLDEALDLVRDKKKDELNLDTSDKTLNALKKRTVATCVTEPLCLASVGRKAGVDRILLARADQDNGTWSLDLDYFDVENTLFLKYHAIEDKSSFRATLGELESGVRNVFDIRSPRAGPNYYGGSSSKALRIIGISSGVVSVASLAFGILNGVQANNLENEINGASRNDAGVYQNLSQQQALDTYNDAQTKALTANVLFGLSAGFAITSGALILTNLPASDQQAGGQASVWKRLRIMPRVGRGSAGIGASFSF
jgi:hypothetical protein